MYRGAGLVRRRGHPGCWCASSRSRPVDLADNHTERSPRQTYSFLQGGEEEEKVQYRRLWLIVSDWAVVRFDPRLVWSWQTFFFFFFLPLCLWSRLINEPPGVWAPAVVARGPSQSPLTQTSGPGAPHLSPSPQPGDQRVWAGCSWLSSTGSGFNRERRRLSPTAEPTNQLAMIRVSCCNVAYRETMWAESDSLKLEVVWGGRGQVLLMMGVTLKYVLRDLDTSKWKHLLINIPALKRS